MFSCSEKPSEDIDDSDESDEDTSLSTGSVKSVSAGYSHTCGLITQGSVECWSSDADQPGEDFGYGYVSDTPTGSFQSVSSGAMHNCGVNSSGTVKCWGSDDFGQPHHPAPSRV